MKAIVGCPYQVFREKHRQQPEWWFWNAQQHEELVSLCGGPEADRIWERVADVFHGCQPSGLEPTVLGANWEDLSQAQVNLIRGYCWLHKIGPARTWALTDGRIDSWSLIFGIENPKEIHTLRDLLRVLKRKNPYGGGTYKATAGELLSGLVLGWAEMCGPFVDLEAEWKLKADGTGIIGTVKINRGETSAEFMAELDKGEYLASMFAHVTKAWITTRGHKYCGGLVEAACEEALACYLLNSKVNEVVKKLDRDAIEQAALRKIDTGYRAQRKRVAQEISSAEQGSEERF